MPGANFAPIRSSNQNENYAVLKAGTRCPTGSTEFQRYFNGNDNTADWRRVGFDDGGHSQCWGNLTLNFCMFRANPSAPGFSFNNFGTACGGRATCSPPRAWPR